ncbi:MAG: GTPase Era [Bdellovibrionaceae bacterium]|nr:GTPase Era [Pseudobdellovibrionaceae bacterium]
MYRAGFVGLVGLPNAGKSSLLNFLVQEKVSIVTEKPQTTRRRILGLWSQDRGQAVFVDAPGLVESDSGLNGFLHQEVLEVSQESDVLVAVLGLDSDRPASIERVLDLVVSQKKPWRALITKTDLRGFEHRHLRIQEMVRERGGQFHSLSLKGKGPERKGSVSAALNEEFKLDREAILNDLLGLLPEAKKPLYDIELFTPETMRNLVAEIVREKCFENVHQEIPYQLAVRILKYDENAGPCPRITAEIVVAKENHKAIVIGKGGLVLKEIGTRARMAIEKLVGEKIFLQLHVSVSPDWMKNKKLMKEFGYKHDKKLG